MKASLAWTISAVSVRTRTTARRSLTTQSGSNVAFSTSARLMAANATGVAQLPAAVSPPVMLRSGRGIGGQGTRSCSQNGWGSLAAAPAEVGDQVLGVGWAVAGAAVGGLEPEPEVVRRRERQERPPPP